MFPVPTGMNRSWVAALHCLTCVPRAHGDEPHCQLVSYRPSSLADAVEDAKAILQGFQPLPSRQRLDKLVQQIELG